jgi:ABC-type branched-subunit amino acid transport system ATPase component
LKAKEQHKETKGTKFHKAGTFSGGGKQCKSSIGLALVRVLRVFLLAEVKF